MPTALSGGANSYVRDTVRSNSLLSSIQSNNVQIIFPPSPPNSQPSSPDTLPTKGYTKSITSSIESTSNKPNHITIATPAKPLLTPRSSTDEAPKMKTRNNVIAKVFPASSTIHSLPKSTVALEETVQGWKGAVVDNPGMGTRTLYVTGGSYEDVNLRDSVCAVLELAEDKLGATGLVICLEKNCADLGELIHQLLYVGGTITTGPFTPNPAYLLVGIEL